MPMLAHLAGRLFNTPLLVERGYAQVVTSVLAPRLNVQPIVAADQTLIRKPAREPMLAASGIMILPVVGGLMHRGDSLDAMSGAESYTHLNNMIVAALGNEKIRGILLDIDSPGGEAAGCFEFADILMDARKQKPIWGVANATACSAAYLILASCNKAYVTRSGQVGSIGVAWLHVDVSQALKEAGVVTTWVYAGDHKVDGNPYDKLSADVKADFQTSVDKTYSLFVDSVAARRPMKADAIRATEARVYRAEEAVSLKLVDGIKSLEGALVSFESHLGGDGPPQIVQHETSEGEPVMSQPTNAPAPVAGVPQAQHEAALAQAREEGRVAGRQEAAAILACKAAETRPKLAATLAGNAKIDPATAEAALGAAAEETSGGVLKALMANADPKLGAGGGDDAKEQRLKELAAVGKRVSAAA